MLHPVKIVFYLSLGGKGGIKVFFEEEKKYIIIALSKGLAMKLKDIMRKTGKENYEEVLELLIDLYEKNNTSFKN